MRTDTRLEQLLAGDSKTIEIKAAISRDALMDEINNLLETMFPGSWAMGEFVDSDSSYLVYDIHCSNSQKNDFFSMRLVDFGNRFLVIRT